MVRRLKMHDNGAVSALSSAPIGRLPLIEVTGNRRVLIENHLGITSYAHHEICVKIHNGTIGISGENLEILCMSKERIVMSGVIDSIHLRREGNG